MFFYLTIAFKEWSVISEKEKNSNFGILRLITAFENKLLSPIAT